MQCKSDLKSDEEIFAEKSRQQTDMQETIDRLEREHVELTQQLEEMQEKIRQLNEQVLAKQLEIDANNARTQVVTNWLMITGSIYWDTHETIVVWVSTQNAVTLNGGSQKSKECFSSIACVMFSFPMGFSL